MKIRTQFYLILFLFGTAIVAVAVSAFITNWKLDKVSRQETLAVKIARGANELSYLASDYLIYREDQQFRRWQRRFASFSDQVAGLQVERPEQQVLVRNLRANQKRCNEVFESVSATSGTRPRARSVAVDPEFFQVCWSRMAIQSQALVSDASRLTQMLRQQMEDLIQTRSLLIYFFMGLFGAFLLVSYILTSHRLLRSLASLRAGTAVIGSGNLDFRIEERKNDEIGELSQAFNRMTNDLKTVTASKADLEREIAERQQAEAALRRSREELERRVQERTAELEKVNEALRHLSAKLLSAQEDERKRIAGELHDSIASSLSAQKFRIEKMAKEMKQGRGNLAAVEELASGLADINQEVRRIMSDLRPAILDDLGIVPAFQWFCREYQKTYSHIQLEKQIGVAETEVPDSLRTPIFRIAQEAMNNIAKYSQGSQVKFSLQKEGGRILLTIQDDGRGFDPEKVKKGMGLSTMQERAHLSGGAFTLESTSGKGTTVQVAWPGR